ncbi:MAG: hypothetical protein HZB56_04950 [Deltaproteobacteria bacterium]|nr:hypothetical protein [Deltaproteobacteria bacterium]
MNRKTVALAAAAVLALGAVAGWLVAREPQGPSAPDAPPRPAPPVEIARERPPPPVDPAQLDRQAQINASRDQFLSLRVAFEGGRPDERSRARLEPALRQLWPGPAPRWSAPCRSRVCRVAVEQAPPGWAEALRDAPAVRAMADRVAPDPDGPEAVAFVLLAAENAPSGAPALEEVEQRLAASSRVGECLRSATQAGTVEYELFVDTTGITYVRGGTADVATQTCVEDQLAEIINTTATPAKVKSESRRISLRTR